MGTELLGTHQSYHHPEVLPVRKKKEVTDIACTQSLNTVSLTHLPHKTH